MLTPGDVDTAVERLLVAFPEKHYSEIVLLQLRKSLLTMNCSSLALQETVKEFVNTGDKMPTFQEIRRRAERKGKMNLNDEALRWAPVERLLEDWGWDLLAMGARPDSQKCMDCLHHYSELRGVNSDDLIFFHRHLTIREIDNPVVELAMLVARTKQRGRRPWSDRSEPWHPMADKIRRLPTKQEIQAEQLSYIGRLNVIINGLSGASDVQI